MTDANVAVFDGKTAVAACIHVMSTSNSLKRKTNQKWANGKLGRAAAGAGGILIRGQGNMCKERLEQPLVRMLHSPWRRNKLGILLFNQSIYSLQHMERPNSPWLAKFEGNSNTRW